MPLPFNRALDLKLLKLVKEHPMLYNPSHPNYVDNDSREVAWQKIGDALNRHAAQFAGIQCQIHFGDFQEEKHKPGFIENLNEFLPEQYFSSWGIEKKILKEYRKHQGLSQIDAKYFYTKTARDLPTYGVTFFLVKEQLKGKKKLVPRLLGINSESILRLDETTKEILQVWPLTHVKTYHTGKKETFTLNFGDYSDKEYCVKTQDAHRIRDILEGYIDIIRKRMLAKHNVDNSEGMVISQDYVEGSKGNIIQHVANNHNKILEQTFVGPSKILPFEKGDQISQGTQIVTVQQILVSDKTNKTQQAIKGEVPVREDMSWDCIKCLNHLNTNSVQIVKYLTDPNDTNLRDARRILANMHADLPIVVDGVKKTAEKQKSEDAKKKLLDELQELEEYMKTLTDSMESNNFDCTAADDAAKRVADVTTLMYFSLDPRTRRRSDMLRRSRKSFIADERTEASLHRASFLLAANTALHSVDNAGVSLGEPYTGEPLSQEDVEELQKATRNNVAALNAAIALYLQAHADPYCIDYSAALASMNSIQELMPELAKNAQALGSVKSDEDRLKFLDEIQDLLDAARKVCTIIGTDEHEKMQEHSVKYADVASKLIFTLGRGSSCSKQDEIIGLAKQVGEKTSALLMTTNELTCQAPGEPATAEVDSMGVKTAHCARDLLACAHLTAPAIHEPHCRSALTASAEALSSSARQMASAWKPLVDHPTRHHLSKQLQQRTMDLAQALDKLNKAYDNIGNDDEVFNETLSPMEIQRLRFIKSASGAENNLKLAEDELNKPLQVISKQEVVNEVEEDLGRKIMHLNAAIASLIAATSDRSNPDYVTAELALSTITDLMPDVVKESKIVAKAKDVPDNSAILDSVRVLCEASQKMCANAGQLGGEEMKDAVSKFADASGRLTYTFSSHANPLDGQQIIELSAEACAKTSQLLTNVQQISESVGGELGDELDKRGTRTVDAAQALLKNAEVTAMTISEPRCEAAFLSSVEALTSSVRDLAETWSAVPSSPRRKELDAELKRLEAILDQLRRICGGTGIPTGCFGFVASPKEDKRLKFINTLSGVKTNLKAAEDEFNKPIPIGQVKNKDVEAAQKRLSDKMVQLYAAIAALVAATSDRDNPDYVQAEEAIQTISILMPDVVKETKLVSSNKNDSERAAMLDQIRALYDATQKICVSAGEDENINESVGQFTDASDKLIFVKSTHANPKTEKKVLDLTSVACGKASHLLANVQQLTEAVGGEIGQELDQRGAKTADAAQALLTNARVTAGTLSEPRCEAAFLSSVEALSSSVRDLAESWSAIPSSPHRKELDADLKELEAILNQLRQICGEKGIATGCFLTTPKKEKRLKFINTLSAVKTNLKSAEDELNKPIPIGQVKNEEVEAAQRRLSDKMAQLNAAIAALVAATSDRENPDYIKAEEAITNINYLMPDVVKETKLVSTNKNDSERAAMLDQIRALYDATQKICVSAGEDENINESVAQFTDASDKLVFVKSTHANPKTERQVLDLTSVACGKASHLLANVQQLTEAVGGEIGQELDQRGAKTADAAQALLTNARLTASTITEPQCRAAFISSVDALSSSSQHLGDCWKKIVDKPYHGLQNSLEKDLKELHDMLKELRGVCQEPSKPSLPSKPAPPARSPTSTIADETQVNISGPVPSIPSSAIPSVINTKPKPPAPPTRTAIPSAMKSKITDVTQQFLDRVRFEENHDVMRPRSPSIQSQPSTPGIRKTDDEKRMHQEFVKNVDDAKEKIKKTEDNLRKVFEAKETAPSPLSATELLNKKQSMQEMLAAVGVQVAALVSANYANKIDFNAASKATNVIPELMSSIVEESKIISGTMKDQPRKVFLDEMLKLCESSTALCDAAKSDREKLNDAAIKFGTNSSKILTVVSSDVDPALEKEIINRAKEIGDSASRIALEAVNVAGNPSSATAAGSDVHNICDAGTKCVDAAGKLVYTAKLVSPSIHNPICQEALISSADTLSNHLKAFSNTWNPLSPDPVQAKSAQSLARETANLEKLLESLRRDVKGGAIGRRREIQKLVIEDTPLRKLTMKIIDDAKYMAECPDVPFSKRSDYAAYADRLAGALRELDIANARCNRSPQDTNKRRDLENAIQELQIVLLQTRPRQDDKPKDNIVDLRDFIQDVSAEAKSMISTASGCGHTESTRGKKAIEEIIGVCHKINEDAIKMTTGDEAGVETSFDDVWQVDNFGQECDSKIKAINSAIHKVEDEKTKNILQKKVLSLSEKCNLLMFATKSGLSTVESISLDETLNDLDDLENKVIKSFVEDAAKIVTVPRRRESPPVPPKPWVKSQLCTAIVNAAQRANAQTLTQAFTTYIADSAIRADLNDHNEKDNLLKHLYKVVHQLKELTVTTSKRLATWQPLQHPEVSKITEQILQEIDHPESKFGVKDFKSHTNVLSAIDANKLLMPCDNVKVEGDAKQLKEKVQQLCTKLSMTSSGVLQSVAKPESLSRSLHATVECANQLRAYAHALKTKQDAYQAKKIEEAEQEISHATYNLLKTSEHVSQTPNHPHTRRKLMGALQQLNDSINKLMRATSLNNKVSQECEEQTRWLLLYQTMLEGPPRVTCALPYTDCLNAIHSHSDVIYKLKSDQKMTKEEFVKDLNFISSVVCNSIDYATQCAYLLSASEKDKDVIDIGLVDVPKLQKLTSSIEETCMSIIRSASVDYAEGDKSKLEKQVGDLIQSINESTDKIKNPELKASLEQCKKDLNVTAIGVSKAFNDHNNKAKLTSSTMELVAAMNRTNALIEDPLLQPQITSVSPERQAWCDDVVNSSKTLITKTQALVKEVKSSPEPEDPGFMMTWHSFNINRKQVLDAFEALLKSVQANDQRAGIIEGSPDEAGESEAPTKSYMQSQLDLTKKWLETPMCKANAKTQGEQAAQNIIDIADKMCNDMKVSENDDMRQLILESKQLLKDCKTMYDNEKYSVLLDRIKELKKEVERGVVTRVVEDFIAGDEPLADLDIIADAEKDETKRKYLLEKKIAELLAQLGRVTKTARFIADTGSGNHTISKELKQCSEQTELLAPMLVKAAQERVTHPDNKAIIDNYKSLLAKYAESLSKVRDLCDQAVDPMDFVQTAGETMQRMREESAKHNDPIKCVQTSHTITKLANRVINVSMSSKLAKNDPELQKALVEAKKRLRDTIPPPNTRASRLPDWRDTTAEILRTTGEVELVLGGENIFNKQPEPDQPIYSVALDLHTAIRDWSSRDNEIVAVAKRTAVLMAKLSDYMNNDRKRELLATSKAIVSESHEVAYLAKKLAHECTDVRIKTNLLKACERIPTISGQLKMLTTVKGSALGHQGTEEDKEAMNMLVHNAHSLMKSIQEVVKAAASASVKIMSQRGPRIKWVRKNYY